MRTIIAATVSTLLSTAALALTPAEVAVVANESSPGSVELARAYLKARDIPQENLILIKTTTNYEVPKVDFEPRIAQPIADALRERKLDDKVRCLCLIWGVPVRVGAWPATPATAPSEGANAITKAHYRLAIDYQLLPTVGKSFPSPQITGLTPLSKLFGSPNTTPHEPLEAPDRILADIATLLASKQKDVSAIADASNRRIAFRQLLGLHMDLYGLEGLRDYIEKYSPEGAPKLEDVNALLAEARKKLDAAKQLPPTPENLKFRMALTESVGGLAMILSLAPQPEATVSVDSALSLLYWRPEDKSKARVPLKGIDAARAVANPLYWRSASRPGANYPKVLMAARIDGPSKEDCLRIIKDSAGVEKKGLAGTVYIDGGVTKVGDNKDTTFPRVYDQQHLKNFAAFLKANTKLKVVLDEKEEVFSPDSCPDAALYVGWYSLRNYVPAFKWVPGAVGYHIASWEAEHLRDPQSNEWCPRLIHNGVVATLGAVNEPLLGAFPVPEEFLELVLTGKCTIAECYWRACPWTNWRMTLIADPLYNPYAANPQLGLDSLPKGLAP